MKNPELLPEVAKLFIEGGLASVQLICRRFDLHYNAAAEIMEELEQKEIVGPFTGIKTREILVKNSIDLKNLLNK